MSRAVLFNKVITSRSHICFPRRLLSHILFLEFLFSKHRFSTFSVHMDHTGNVLIRIILTDLNLTGLLMGIRDPVFLRSTPGKFYTGNL